MGGENEPGGLLIDARSAISVRGLAKSLQKAFRIRVHEDDAVVIATEFANRVLSSQERNEDLIDIIRQYAVERANRDEFDATVERRYAADYEGDDKDEFGPAANDR
jgi:hypothetical protein